MYAHGDTTGHRIEHKATGDQPELCTGLPGPLTPQLCSGPLYMPLIYNAYSSPLHCFEHPASCTRDRCSWPPAMSLTVMSMARSGTRRNCAGGLSGLLPHQVCLRALSTCAGGLSGLLPHQVCATQVSHPYNHNSTMRVLDYEHNGP